MKRICEVCKNPILAPYLVADGHEHWNRICPVCVSSKCAQKRNRDLESKLSLAGVPSRYVKARLSDFDTYPDPESPSLLLYGPSGSGKTHLAASVLASRMDTGVSHAKFIPAINLLAEFRHTMNSKSEKTEMELVEWYSGLEILVLDDIGTEKDTEWSLGILYMIVNNRYNEFKCTLFTSNLDPQSMTEKIGPRLTSRIMGMGKAFKMTGNRRKS